MNIPKIKLQLEYDEKISIIDCEIYKPISFIYERAEQIYFPLKFSKDNKIITFHSKDISSYSHLAIGEYFKNKNKISLKVVDPVHKKIPNELLSKHKFNFIAESFNPEDDYVKGERIHIEANENTRKIVTDNKDKSLKCQECGNNGNIDSCLYYCRKCKDFLCKNCRFSKSHINHKSIIMNNCSSLGLEETVKLYCSNVKAESSLCVKSFEGYRSLLKDVKLMNFDSNKKIINDKLMVLDKKIGRIKEVLPDSDTNEESLQELNKINSKLIDEINRIQKEAQDIIINMKKNIRKEKDETNKNSSMKSTLKKADLLNMNESYNNNPEIKNKMLGLFESISSMEDDVEYLSQKILALKINFDIHSKIEQDYNRIIEEIDCLIKKETYKFSIEFSQYESSFVPSEITAILRQTANTKGSFVTTSINNLIHLGKIIKSEMDESYKKESEKEKISKSNVNNNKDKVKDINKSLENSKNNINSSRQNNLKTMHSLEKLQNELQS